MLDNRARRSESMERIVQPCSMSWLTRVGTCWLEVSGPASESARKMMVSQSLAVFVLARSSTAESERRSPCFERAAPRMQLAAATLSNTRSLYLLRLLFIIGCHPTGEMRSGSRSGIFSAIRLSRARIPRKADLSHSWILC